MRVLQVHNAYRQPGGEDQVVAAERELLEEHGHEVRIFGADNDEIGGLRSRLAVAWKAPYDPVSRRRLAAEIENWRPDVVHVHNFFPLLTPAVFDACEEQGVPVVMTLHNFRLVCPGAFLYRQNSICEDCLGGRAWRGVVHRCYRGSLLGSWAVARMVDHHRQRRTWHKMVDRFIVMSEFARQKFAAAGWDPERIAVKPHFCAAPGETATAGERSGALFAGRLSPEKGVNTLLTAWAEIPHPLLVAGDGPLRGAIETSANAEIRLLGWLSRQDLSTRMRQAACLVVPSEWYETFGMVVIEAFAHGLPVVAARIGALAELVDDGVNGLLFSPGDADDLANKVRRLLENPAEAARMGDQASAVFSAKYTPEINYPQLLQIYQEAIDAKKIRSRPRH